MSRLRPYIQTKQVTRLAFLLTTAVFAFVSTVMPGIVSATADETEPPSSQTDIHSFVSDTAWYDPTAGICTPLGSNAVTADDAQASNARAIIGIAKTLSMGRKGALIGLITAMQESHLTNLANTGIPLSLTNPGAQGNPGNDHDSIGIMQQRVSTGWSTFGNYTNGQNPEKDQNIVNQLMNQAYAAQAFFGTPPDAQLPDGLAQPSALKKGLQNLDQDWRNMEPGAAAQAVQMSAFPDAYSKHVEDALAYLDEYWDGAPEIPLPISITGGTANGLDIGADACSSLTGGTVDNIVAKIWEYAWPTYCRAGSSSCDPSIGYDSPTTRKPEYATDIADASYKGSCAGVDCGAFVTLVMRNSGADPEYNTGPEGNTASQLAYLRRNSDGEGPSKDNNCTPQPGVQKYVQVLDEQCLSTGDIAIRADGNFSGHTFMYVGSISKGGVEFGGAVASSSQCERAPMAGPMDTFGNYEWYRLVKQ